VGIEELPSETEEGGQGRIEYGMELKKIHLGRGAVKQFEERLS